ncbi:MAG: Maf family protein [Acidobacteriota bacterium]
MIILASASPRRRELLDLLGIEHQVRPADIDEIRAPGESPEAFARRAAEDKARHVALSFDEPVLAADTVVALGDESLGKPIDRTDAKGMLTRLSGREHAVHTGMALALGDRCHSLVDTAIVRFSPLDDAQINWYVATGEPMDKAGAYAVQGAGGLLVHSITGSPQTVIGLPINRLPELFGALGLDIPLGSG